MSNSNDLTNFDQIFDCIVLPLINELPQYMDEKFKNSVGFKHKDLQKAREDCKSFYETKKTELKKIFYGSKYNKAAENDLKFDIHKIASIICSSLIKHKIFIFNDEVAFQTIEQNGKFEDTTWIIDNALINYKLAFKVSVAMIYYKLLHESNDDAKIFFERHHGLSLYKKREGHESFENSVILDFAKRDIHGRSFDYFLYSAFLFQLEEYNKKVFELNIIQQKLRINIFLNM